MAGDARLGEHDGGRLWATGAFSLSDVLAGRAPCPPEVRALVVVAWRPPARPQAPEAQPAPIHGGLVRARRASDFARPKLDEEEATLRMAWERALGVLRPLAAQRIGPLDLAFAAGDRAEIQPLFDQLAGTGGDWRVGYAQLSQGLSSAVRALELWVLDAPGPGSWLVDVTDLS